MAWRIGGDLDQSALEAALADVVARHESLRTIFPERDGVPLQGILPAHEASCTLAAEDIAEADLAERLAAAVVTPFDLAREIPIRAWLFRIERERHVLLVLLHHISGDGWSLGPLWRDLTRAYTSRHQGEPPAWVELPVQYADYTLWQRALLGEDDASESTLAGQLAFWRKALCGAPDELSLPFDRPRPPIASHRGATVPVRLDAELHQRLVELAQANGASLFMVLQAAVAALLNRLGAGDDIAIGVPVAARGERALEDLVGFFVNTLVMRTDLSGDPSFRELVSRVRAFALGAYAHQDVPFDRVVEALQPARSLARHPLFQVMLVLRNTPDFEVVLPGLAVHEEPLVGVVSKFDLLLSLGESLGPGKEPAGIGGTLEYSTDLFDTKTADSIVARFVRLLEKASRDPDTLLLRLSVLERLEREKLLEGFNATAWPVPETTLPDLFEAQVARNPEAVALIFGTQSLDYGELNARANRLAHHLIGLGVGPESLVAVCLERSVEMVVGLLAVLKAGGAYVPLDPDYPGARLTQMLADAAPAVVLTTSALLDRLPRTTSMITLDAPETLSLLAQAHGHDPTDRDRTCTLRPLHPAYVIYTSGSTGTPKGASNTHQGLVNRILWMQAAYGLNATDGVLQKTPYSFDVSVWEFFWPLLFGARLVVTPPGKHRDPRYLIDVIVDERVTTLHFVPPMLHAFLEHPECTACGSLRRVICSGEALSGQVQSQFFSKLPEAELHNLYGPTEASIDVTAWSCRKDDGDSTPPIGSPIWNTRMYVLDDHLEPVPIGVAGDLYIAGLGLARGYLRRSRLTAERFVADPHATTPGQRMYRTGDLARWRANGSLEFLGRADHQVKIRGFRIELGEIEAALAGRLDVAQAAVIARDDGSGGKRLFAYIVAARQAVLDAPALRHYLAERLPDYMVPSAFVMIDALPLTSNGKLDRQALPEPKFKGTTASEKRNRPRTVLEQDLAGIWRRLFERENIGHDDHFFDLGGHSLLAVRLVAEIERQTNRRLPISLLFQSPTIASLARILSNEAWAPTWSSLVPMQPLGSGPAFFCVHGLGGEVYDFLNLARELAPDRKVYGLQAVGLDGLVPRHKSVEEMAAHYACEIRSVQIEGPYHLMGHSLGGWLAYAVAQELSRQGQKVALLALVDTRGTCDLPLTLRAGTAE